MEDNFMRAILKERVRGIGTQVGKSVNILRDCREYDQADLEGQLAKAEIELERVLDALKALEIML